MSHSAEFEDLVIDTRYLDTPILIVDDLQDNIDLLIDFLQDAGYTSLSHATSGQAALDMLEKDASYGLILLDLMMPGMDGFEALPLIKEAHPATSVIVLTALDAEEAEEGVLFGASGFVEKRYIAERLETVIRTCAGHGT
jgi:CheY-like chemotaxis protein